MELDLLNAQGQASGKVSAPDELLGRDYNESLVHQLVTAYRANARQGTRSQKTRATVAHTTKKPWNQKGTGRARAGMTSSPIWRGGGRAFPNQPWENFTQKVNKKMYRAGMASIFSQLAREGRLVVVETIAVDAPKTKMLADKFKSMGLESVMYIAAEVSDNLYLASRNLPNVLVTETRYVDPMSLIFYKKILVTQEALDQLKEMFA
ncbi:50S ribosomal protein L4 [Amphibiibacter pelophylacis]|uniref:50S ribosomal protein L4 n=1 Tax=Amphibiibacter pelophylacis TaxID=1799477 RepID=A0ACC6P4W2_9BURK